jgi:hypothetical protein
MKLHPRLKGRRWTAEDDDRLKSLIEASVSIHLIAANMKRTTQGVKSRAHALGISIKRVWVGPKGAEDAIKTLRATCRDRAEGERQDLMKQSDSYRQNAENCMQMAEAAEAIGLKTQRAQKRT